MRSYIARRKNGKREKEGKKLRGNGKNKLKGKPVMPIK